METEDEQELGVSHITYRPTLPKDFGFHESRAESQDSRGERKQKLNKNSASHRCSLPSTKTAQTFLRSLKLPEIPRIV